MIGKEEITKQYIKLKETFKFDVEIVPSNFLDLK